MATFNGWRLTRTGVLFFAGALVLIALVAGGLWLAKERGDQARRDEAIRVAEQNLNEQSDGTVAISTDQSSEQENDSTSQSSTATTSDELPATGPEVLSLLPVMVLALSLSYYVASRRALAQL